MKMKLRTIKLHLLNLPLKVPYHLSFADVTQFDTVIVEMGDGDGRTGFGEATILAGYSGETIEDTWAFCREKGAGLAGRNTEDAKASLDPFVGGHPFAVSAFVTAMEMLAAHPLLETAEETRVPLLGAVNATDVDEIPGQIEDLLDQGYGTLKIKVGMEVEADLKRIGVIQRAVSGRALMRLDGNQGYSRDDACRFAAALDPGGIQLLEQPCAAGDWDAAQAVARVSAVPMMMDESIFGLDDIRRSADLGAAAFIKLKLMKMGGLDRLMEGLDLIEALGMEPVLGNGVAADVGCWMEACAAARTIRNAGELNGFLRPVGGLFAEPMRVERGALVLPAGFTPALDPGKLGAVTVAAEIFSD